LTYFLINRNMIILELLMLDLFMNCEWLLAFSVLSNFIRTQYSILYSVLVVQTLWRFKLLHEVTLFFAILINVLVLKSQLLKFRFTFLIPIYVLKSHLFLTLGHLQTCNLFKLLLVNFILNFLNFWIFLIGLFLRAICKIS
jgi:hypothetical protein